MRPSPVMTIERARYRALIDMPRISLDALRQARFFHCGPSDSFRIVRALESTLEAERVRTASRSEDLKRAVATWRDEKAEELSA